MRFAREVLSWAAHFIAAFVLAVLISMFAFQPTYVEGRSMEATLQDRDRVFVSKLIHTLHVVPDYEDIVIIDSRIDRSRSFFDDVIETINSNIITQFIFGTGLNQNYWIKRVIGKPGDVLEFIDGKVVRNGMVLDEPYLREPAVYYDRGAVLVPEGHIFVMGDNRNISRDSREIGCIPFSHIIGKYKNQ